MRIVVWVGAFSVKQSDATIVCYSILNYRTECKCGIEIMLGFTRNAILVVVVVCLALLSHPVHGKLFRKCDLVKDLTKNGVSRAFVSSFVCVAMNESGMNSTLVTTQAYDVKSYGIFQVNSFKRSARL